MKVSIADQIAMGRELLQHARARDKSFETSAIEAEREGDTEGTWIAMASRANNKRFIDRLESDLAELEARPAQEKEAKSGGGPKKTTDRKP